MLLQMHMAGNGPQGLEPMRPLITESLIQLNKADVLMKTAITFVDTSQNWLTYRPLKFMSHGYSLMDIARDTPSELLITQLSAMKH